MPSDLRYSAILSTALHVLILLALLVTFPWSRPDEPAQETAFTVQMEGTAAQSAKSLRQGKTPAQEEAQQQQDKPPSKAPPKDAPIEAPPPPPPPPPPPAAEAPAVPLPPQLTPPPELSPLAEPTPPQKQAPPTPTPPAQSQSTAPQPTPAKTPPAPSRTSQPNPTTNAVADSKTIENTLEKLRALQEQKQPPKHKYNPDSGGAPNAGGDLNGSDTSKLSKSQMGAIGDHVRQCWSYDAGAQNADSYAVRLEVVTDETGTSHEAKVVGPDVNREAADPAFRAFAERAVRAVLSPHCANLPLPAKMLGARQTLEFNFRP